MIVTKMLFLCTADFVYIKTCTMLYTSCCNVSHIPYIHIDQRLKQKEATCKDGSIEEDNDKRKKREAIARLKAKQRTEV